MKVDRRDEPLEMGIDMGAVDQALLVQLVAARVTGRASRSRAEVSSGWILPGSRIPPECAVIAGPC